MKRYLLLLGAFVCAFNANAITISNGLSGVGRWEVDVQGAGTSNQGNLTYSPSTTTDLIYYFGNFYRTSSSDAYSLISGGVPEAVGTDGVRSTMTVLGPNGPIDITFLSTIIAGSPVLNTQITFSSANPFGFFEWSSYFDEDVLGAGNDNVIAFGTSPNAGFQLLTVDASTQVGVAQSANFTPTGATYIGYGVHFCCSDASTGITVPVITDPRYPGQVAYGTGDLTTNFNFRLNPTATSAQILIGIGGSPTGQQVPTEPPGVPEPSTMMLAGAALGVVGYWRRRSA